MYLNPFDVCHASPQILITPHMSSFFSLPSPSLVYLTVAPLCPHLRSLRAMTPFASVLSSITPLHRQVSIELEDTWVSYFFLLDARSCEDLCVDEISLFWASSRRHLPRTASQLTSMSAHLSVAALPLWSAVAGPSPAASQSPLFVQLQCKNHHPWCPFLSL